MQILFAVHAKLKHEKKVEKHKKLKAQDAEEKRALELGEEVRSPIEISHWGLCPF
jgi:ribosome production factor 1